MKADQIRMDLERMSKMEKSRNGDGGEQEARNGEEVHLVVGESVGEEDEIKEDEDEEYEYEEPETIWNW